MDHQRTALVTGAYGAIGKAIARGLAEREYRLVLVGRNTDALEALQLGLSKDTGNADISHEAIDLSRKYQIEAFARKWDGPLHVLVNNAAATPRTRMETPEGIEMQFATNVLGYLWMSNYFAPFMENQEDARIVNVASYWAGDLKLDDLEFRARRYHNDTAYRQTKQANRMLTVALASRFKGKGIAVMAAHPGDVNSKLSNNLGYGGHESPEQGAATPLFCAAGPSLKGVTGKYYEHMTEVSCHFSRDSHAVEKLYDICTGY